MTDHHVLVVGAGAAGTSAAVELRRCGFTGQVTILNGEAHTPYNRTTVNKTLLEPDADLTKLGQPIPDDDLTTLVTGVAAEALDLRARAVRLGDGSRLDYDSLLVASGALPRHLGIPVDEGAGRRVTTLRTAADAARIRDLLAEVGRTHARPARVIVAGASLLGSETADSLNALGHEVYLVDPSPAPLTRLLGPTIGTWVRHQHQGRLNAVLADHVTRVAATDDGALLACLTNGATLAGDVLIVTAGVEPDTRWLAGTALDSPDGIATDGHLRASNVSHVYAAGDVARVDGGRRGEHWGQALAQGAHAARTIAHDLGVTEDPGIYAGTASYATRLYGKPISVSGDVHQGSAVELLHDPGAGLCVTIFVVDGDQLGGAVVLGAPKVARRLRPLIERGATLQEAAEVLRELGMSPTRPPQGEDRRHRLTAPAV